ncbi:uncharacterized protein LOC133293794 [Gastrolobium bilobum]|uniref:uncharacterized protein LOC133293794 n=1 Tax=Gastrolobium bilobum TaxID=150636 RepID=UPI002AB296D7|nr:uncharacterized protein LOC133293794 [Gastrolobium bilobum]
MYSVYMLEGDAHEWWYNASRPFTIQGEELTWALFERLFHEEYFPRDVREDKQGEFDKLVQGTTTVDAYVAKFNELVKFANYGGMLPAPEILSSKFQRGLNEKIAKRMSNTAVRQPPGKFKRGGGQRSGFNDRNSNPRCEKCKRYHQGPCTAAPNSCFKSGKVGHFAKDCYSNTGQAANLQSLPSAPTVGRVYTTNVQQTEKAPNLVKDVFGGRMDEFECLRIENELHEKIKETQIRNDSIKYLKGQRGISLNEQGLLLYQRRIVVPKELA